MDGGHDEIEAREYLVLVIEAPIGEDIAFDALEEGKIVVPRVEPVYRLPLPLHVLDLQTPRVGGALAVVARCRCRKGPCAGQPLQWPRDRRSRRSCSCGRGRPPSCRPSRRAWEACRLAGLYLAHVLPQLGRDVGEAERP